MKKYSKYKKTNINWIGEIPENWNLEKFIYFGSFNKGRGISKSQLTEEGDPVVLYGDIYTKYYLKTDIFIRKAPKSVTKSSTSVFKGDLLLTGSGETKEEIGKCIAYLGDEDAFAGGDVIIFTPHKHNSLFLSYLLNSSPYEYEKARNGKGEIVVHIYSSQLRDIKAIIPTREEQTAIATYLDNKTTLIDKLISSNEKQIKLLEEKRKATINQAVTKGLDTGVKMKDSGVEWIGEIPEEWKIVRIGSIANVGSSKRVFEESYQEEGIPFYRSKEIVELSKGLETSARIYIPEKLYKEIQMKYTIPQREDLLVTSIGTIGLTWLCDGRDFYYKDGNITQIHGLGKVSMRFLQFCFDSYLFKVQYDYMSAGSTLMALTIEKIKTLQMGLPYLEEQEKIISFLDEKIDGINTLIKKIKTQNTLLKEYRKSLISHVVTGKVDVREEKVRINNI